MSQSPGADFRLFLQDELASRCQKNSRYSLRAFARSLGIGSSDLSKLIRRQRQLSPEMLSKLANRLDLDPETLREYSEALELQLKIHRQVHAATQTPADNYRQISLDTFRLIADWYHFAILELIKVRGFRGHSAWIAKRLGLTASEVNIAVQRLKRLNFLEVTSRGKWCDKVGATTSVSNGHTDSAKRLQQRQILTKSIEALEDIPLELRDHSTVVMAIDSSRIPAAKGMIRDFRRQLSTLLEKGSDKDQVYVLNVSLFPVTKGEIHDKG